LSRPQAVAEQLSHAELGLGVGGAVLVPGHGGLIGGDVPAPQDRAGLVALAGVGQGRDGGRRVGGFVRAADGAAADGEAVVAGRVSKWNLSVLGIYRSKSMSFENTKA
jgi:hypothetical protein